MTRDSKSGGVALIPFVGGNGDPPALDLAQLRIRDLNLQRKPWDPDGDFQLGGKMLVREVHDGVHFAFHFFPVHKDGVAVVGNLVGNTNKRNPETDGNVGSIRSQRFSNCVPRNNEEPPKVS